MTYLTLTRNVLAAAVVVLGAIVPAASAGAQPAAASKQIAFVVGNMTAGAPVWSMTMGGKYASDDVGGMVVTVSGPTPPNPAAEVKLLQTAIASHPAGIVFENLAPPMFTQLEAQAIGKGIPIVALDTPPMPASKVTLYVGSDNIGLGATEAQQIIKQLPANTSGTVIVVDANHGSPVFDVRAKSAADTVAKALPKVKVITVNAPCLAGLDAACSSAVAAAIKASSHLVAVLGTGSLDSVMAAQVKKAQGGTFLIVGLVLSPAMLQAIKNGTILCTVSPEQYLEGYIAMRFMADSLKSGKALPTGWFDLPGLVVDKSLVDVITTRQASDATMRAWLRPEIARIFANVSPYMKPLSAAR
jgi:ABC-type sugar transport system substrate-binding protein